MTAQLGHALSRVISSMRTISLQADPCRLLRRADSQHNGGCCAIVTQVMLDEVASLYCPDVKGGGTDACEKALGGLAHDPDGRLPHSNQAVLR